MIDIYKYTRKELREILYKEANDSLKSLFIFYKNASFVLDLSNEFKEFFNNKNSKNLSREELKYIIEYLDILNSSLKESDDYYILIEYIECINNYLVKGRII